MQRSIKNSDIVLSKIEGYYNALCRMAQLVPIREFSNKSQVFIDLHPFFVVRDNKQIAQLHENREGWHYIKNRISRTAPSKMKHGVPRDVDEPEMVYLSIAGGTYYEW